MVQSPESSASVCPCARPHHVRLLFHDVTDNGDRRDGVVRGSRRRSPLRSYALSSRRQTEREAECGEPLLPSRPVPSSSVLPAPRRLFRSLALFSFYSQSFRSKARGTSFNQHSTGYVEQTKQRLTRNQKSTTARVVAKVEQNYV